MTINRQWTWAFAFLVPIASLMAWASVEPWRIVLYSAVWLLLCAHHIHKKMNEAPLVIAIILLLVTLIGCTRPGYG